MSEPLSYLDYNAEAPLKPAVAEAMAAASGQVGNPSSVHGFGRLARRALEDARARVGALAGADPENVIFTSGGTEANNLALAAVAPARRAVSAVEHDSVLAASPDAAVVAVDGDGVIDLSALEAALIADPAPTLLSIMLANNETGVIQPVAEAGEMIRAHGALLHCDAVQGAGRIAVSLGDLGADLLSLSAHKMGGPQGAGALVLGDGVEVAAMLHGGRQEAGRRAGSENVAALVGFGVAAELAAADIDEMEPVTALRDRVEAELVAIAPQARILGAGAPRLGNTTCVTMPGVAAETQVMALDLAGVAVSSGAACSSGKVGPSHVLAAMAVDPAVAARAVRVSLGWASTTADVDRLIEAWTALYERSRENDLHAGSSTG